MLLHKLVSMQLILPAIPAGSVVLKVWIAKQRGISDPTPAAEMLQNRWHICTEK